MERTSWHRRALALVGAVICAPLAWSFFDEGNTVRGLGFVLVGLALLLGASGRLDQDGGSGRKRILLLAALALLVGLALVYGDQIVRLWHRLT